MAVNLANKYQKAIDQAYTLGSLTKSAFGGKFDFIGAKTVNVYSLTAQVLGDYTRTGANRYGTPTEVQDTVAEYTLTKDRSFSSVIDKGNYIQGNLVKTTGAYTKVQMEEVVTPELDTYNLAVLYASATSASQVTTVATTKTTAYETFLALQENLDNNKVPVKGRIAFVNAAYHNQLKQDDTFVKASDIAMKALINGQVGEVDGVKIVKVPASYLPANVNIILTHPSANVNPMQLEELNSHDNPPGISGALIEGRFIYDAFTFEKKEVACAANKIV